MSKKPLITMARRAAVAVAVTATLAGCATSTTGSVTGSNRSQLLLVSEAEMVQASQQAFNQRKSAAQSKGVLISSGADYNRVVNIMRRLSTQVAHFRPDAARWNWDLALIRNNDVNANVMPGGKVTVYTGLYQKLNLTDDELAAVIGHEMAHALREHSKKAVGQQALTGLAASIGGAVLQSTTGASSDTVNLGANILSEYGVNMPFSRSQESEADLLGVRLMAQAGYNPQAAISVWEKMNSVSDNNNALNAITSSHPTNNARISAIRRMLPEVMPIYEQSRR